MIVVIVTKVQKLECVRPKVERFVCRHGSSWCEECQRWVNKVLGCTTRAFDVKLNHSQRIQL